MSDEYKDQLNKAIGIIDKAIEENKNRSITFVEHLEFQVHINDISGEVCEDIEDEMMELICDGTVMKIAINNLKKKVRPKECSACSGSGYYDSNGSPPCGACDGTGVEEC